MSYNFSLGKPEIENDPQIDEEWVEPVKGHVVKMKREEECVNLADVRKT
jgi:hypothetical protein